MSFGPPNAHLEDNAMLIVTVGIAVVEIHVRQVPFLGILISGTMHENSSSYPFRGCHRGCVLQTSSRGFRMWESISMLLTNN